MILEGLHVDGFGLHRDLRWDGLSPGLNLVVGPNEAGKSTLHSFVRGVLFGFPDGRSREPSYPPLRGGAHGGRLRVRTPEGEFTVERRAGGRKRIEIRGPSGEVGGPELLDRLTGGADARLFRGVFAFGLAELSGLEALAEEEVAARIFDAGLAGEGRAAAEAMGALASARGRELSPRGGRIRETVRELERLEGERRAAVERARGHGAVLAALDEEREALATASRRLEARRAESRRFALLRSLWPHEVRRREGEALLAAEGEVAPIAADALARFDAAGEAHLLAVHALAAKDQALAGLRAEHAAVASRRPAPSPTAGAAAGHRAVATGAVAAAVAFGIAAVAAAAAAGPWAAAGWAAAALVAGAIAVWLRGAVAAGEAAGRDDASGREALAALAGRIGAAEEERARLAAAVSAAAARLAAVRAETGAADRDALAARVQRWKRVCSARDAVDAARRGIALALGEGAEAEALRAWLGTGELAAWDEERARAEEEAARLAADVEARARAVGARERELRDLEESADVPRLGAAIAAREAELAASVGRFREAALLERLIREALEAYRRERQPAVLRRAGEAFARITAGRYVRVLQAAEPGALEVVDRDGRCLPVEALGRGAREQLYVCVRLGLAATVAERGTRLPLLLDDVLVNFDPERAAATAEVLAGFAREHQVLVFTCHPSTVELLLAAAPGAPALHLSS